MCKLASLLLKMAAEFSVMLAQTPHGVQLDRLVVLTVLAIVLTEHGIQTLLNRKE